MQDLTRTSTLGTAYTPTQVLAQYTRSSDLIRFQFDRLNASGVYIGDLTPYVDRGTNPSIVWYDASAAVKRTCQLYLVGNPPLNPLTDLIRVRYQLLMPDGGFVDFSLGIFTVLQPGKRLTPGPTWRQVDGADLSQLLIDASFSSAFAVKKGSTFISGILQILSILGLSYLMLPPFGIFIPDSGATLAADIGWTEGESGLKAMNDLLTAVNYLPLWFDEGGQMRSSLIPDYTSLVPAFTFDLTTNSGLAFVPIEENPDVGKAFNEFPILVEDPRRATIKQVYVNSNPLSPISTISWQRRKRAQPIRDSNIPDALTALNRGKIEAAKSAREFDTWRLHTPPWPFWQDQDVCQVNFNSTDEGSVSATYLNTGWHAALAPNGQTTHDLARIFPV